MAWMGRNANIKDSDSMNLPLRLDVLALRATDVSLFEENWLATSLTLWPCRLFLAEAKRLKSALRKVAPPAALAASPPNPRYALWQRECALLSSQDPVGENWQSSSFSGGVFVEKKASPNEWQILMVCSGNTSSYSIFSRISFNGRNRSSRRNPFFFYPGPGLVIQFSQVHMLSNVGAQEASNISDEIHGAILR
ncbi:hypothetical protein Tco_1248048 [Tanacetum coccineum]